MKVEEAVEEDSDSQVVTVEVTSVVAVTVELITVAEAVGEAVALWVSSSSGHSVIVIVVGSVTV